MTRESFECAEELLRQIKEVEETMKSIKIYCDEELILTITTKKGMIGYLPNSETEREFRLRSDSPLFLSIYSSLIDLRDELEIKFKNLDSSSLKEEKIQLKKQVFGVSLGKIMQYLSNK